MQIKSYSKIIIEIEKKNTFWNTFAFNQIFMQSCNFQGLELTYYEKTLQNYWSPSPAMAGAK